MALSNMSSSQPSTRCGGGEGSYGNFESVGSWSTQSTYFIRLERQTAPKPDAGNNAAEMNASKVAQREIQDWWTWTLYHSVLFLVPRVLLPGKSQDL